MYRIKYKVGADWVCVDTWWDLVFIKKRQKLTKNDQKRIKMMIDRRFDIFFMELNLGLFLKGDQILDRL